MLKRKIALSLVLACTTAMPAMAEKYIVYIGSYTNSPASSTSKGVYAARFDTDNPSTLTPLGLVAETVNPAYLTGSKDGKTLYAPNWQSPRLKTNELDTVSTFRIDRKTGNLTPLNIVTSDGALPNEAITDRSGKVVVVVNYGSDVRAKNNAGVAALKILPDGKLADPFYVDIHPNEPIAPPPAGRGGRGGAAAAGRGGRGGAAPAPDPLANFGAHVHGIAFSTNDKYVFIADLGNDRIYTYKLDASKPSMSPIAGTPYIHVGPGSGPRREVVSPDGKFLYCAYQDNAKTGVFRIAADGSLTLVQEAPTVPADFKGGAGVAEIAIDHQGNNLYVSNRGPSTIVHYTINKADGTLTAKDFIPSQGQSPRNMTLNSTGKYLFVANQGSGDVVVFRLEADGNLTFTGAKTQVSQAAGVYLVKAQ